MGSSTAWRPRMRRESEFETANGRVEDGAAPTELRDVDPRLFVGSVEKGMRVLRAFYNQSTPLSLTEVAERTGLGRSAAQRFIYTLKALGYLRQDPKTRH